MKSRVRGLAALPFLFALHGLAANTVVGCATGSNADDGSPDAGSSGDDDAAANGDSNAAPDVAIDAYQAHDGASGVDSSADQANPGAEAGDDASADTGPADTGPIDTGIDSAPIDAGPTVIFGSSCPTGTRYTEPFTSDPVADGTFLPLTGSYTYDAANALLSLATTSGANTQLWIGPRPTWTGITVSARVRIDSTQNNGNGGFTFRMESTPASPSNNAGQMYYAGLATNQVLVGLENGNWTEFSGPSGTFAIGTFYTLSVTANGTSLSVSVDGTPYVTSYVDSTYTFGSIGLRTYASSMTYGALTVTCL
jgi:hypothetical protein